MAREHSLNCSLFRAQRQKKSVNHLLSMATGPPQENEEDYLQLRLFGKTKTIFSHISTIKFLLYLINKQKSPGEMHWHFNSQ